MESIQFKKEWLKNYAIIDKPVSKVELTSVSNVSEKNRVEDKYIVNLKAIAKDQLPAVLNLFKDADEVNIKEMNGLTLTATIWANDGTVPTELPMKGETVICNIDYVENREGQQVLRVTTMSQRAAVKATQFDFDELFAAATIAQDENVIEHSASN